MVCPKVMCIIGLLLLLLVSCKMSQNNYVSHSKEPKKMDKVKNTNPKCLHYASEGVVLDIKSLPNGMGKVVTYAVLNNGPTFKNGDLLTKTMDQLSPK